MTIRAAHHNAVMADDDVQQQAEAPRSSARDRVLLATIEELTEVGAERASLRSIARRVGITHQAVGHYFPDRTALFTHVAVAGFAELVRRSRVALESTDPQASAGAPVAALGQTYVQFARANPAQFRLMFASSLVDRRADDLAVARRSMWTLLLDVVSTACEHGWGSGNEPRVLAVACWSAAHGLAALEQVEGEALPAWTSSEDVLQMITRAVGSHQ